MAGQGVSYEVRRKAASLMELEKAEPSLKKQDARPRPGARHFQASTLQHDQSRVQSLLQAQAASSDVETCRMPRVGAIPGLVEHRQLNRGSFVAEPSDVAKVFWFISG